MSQELLAKSYTPWQLLKAYWQSEQRFSAYVLLFFVLLMTGGLVGLDVTFTYWYNLFYNALQDYQARNALDLLLVFLFLASIYIVVAVYRYYLQSILALRWRRWMTDQFMKRWLEKRSYYYLEEFIDQTDNPDQRIQEDIGALVTSSLSLLVGLLSSVVTFFAFIFVLWELSGTIHIPLGTLGALDIPGYLVWVAIIYAAVGTFLTFKIGKPLPALNFEQQRREANFRFAAIDLRSHAEHIALYRGEHHQKNIIHRIFDGVLNNWYAIILRQKLLLWFTAGYNQVSVIVPLVVALPNYFNKVFKLGGLIQTLAAFRNIQDALSFLVNSYVAIAEWRAVMRRLITFINRIYEVENEAVRQNHFYFSKDRENKISTKNLYVLKPDGEVLLQKVNEEFIHGKNYLIKGDSGIGKSTLVRAIAGIWPFGSGEIILPQKNIMFIPQRSYMPLGSLREGLLFPNSISVSDEKLIQLLEACQLPNLITKLDQISVWSEHLSPGELQRIAFVRMLLHKPDWVFLDESTSSLDLKREKYLYELLKERLPKTSFISVGHRPSLDAYHDHIIDVMTYINRDAVLV